MNHTPVILLHGAIGAEDQLQNLGELLSNKGKNVYTFSFSGHGKVPFKFKGFGIDEFVEELHDFIVFKGLIKPDVFGYSMGGFVALRLASENPAILGSIITLGTKFAWDPETAIKEAAMLNAETLEEKVPKFADTLKQRHGEESWKQLLSKTADMMKALGNDKLLTEEKLKQVQNRVLIGLADKDNMVSLEETHNVYKLLPNASMYMLPGSKHPIEQVNTVLLSKIILDFTSQ
ncbi:MAG TPA: alpha/beta fold hydrolase [Bacteroidia bacterium]